MGPQGRDPMFPVRNPALGANPAVIDPGRQGLGQQFRPIQPQGAQPGMMPPQAQGSPYGVPFVGLGNPMNPAGRPASPRAANGLAQALSSAPFGTRRAMGGGGRG
jgi:hypothetical protein